MWHSLSILTGTVRKGKSLESGGYLEGQGDLVSKLRMGIVGGTIWVIRVINLLTRPPDPPSNVWECRVYGLGFGVQCLRFRGRVVQKQKKLQMLLHTPKRTQLFQGTPEVDRSSNDDEGNHKPLNPKRLHTETLRHQTLKPKHETVTPRP